ncbi:methyl-galactoside transport system permease protein [Caloramator quimbayensis]|uniref:Methyl-galactoside transport system permease protein n=1 Tax=Caloramator quimbayensis TaxID=1147123 RepID=A0A1T4XQB4_9CLOT|nr:galactose/methyl galactoside ABC transporter permease MglC [Caloramator quimbayensis]SKA91275.1 methyl-galactoside transport system permease protein [Caloramator quimbayensis]
MQNVKIKKTINFISQNFIYLFLLLLIIIIAFINPNFLSLTCLRDILLQCSTRVIIAVGMFCILLTGGVDLGAGRVIGFTAVLSASMLQTTDYARRFYPNLPQQPLFIPILIALLAGVVVGILNGIIISRFSVPPFIATLGTQVIVYGITSIYFDLPPNNSQPIGGLRKDFTFLGSGSIGGIPIIVILAILIAAIAWLVFTKTSFGKNTYAIGGNRQAAEVSGINVKMTLFIIYTVASLCFAFAGVLEAARTGGATNNYGFMYEFDAIAACFVGGVSTTGGIGTIPGVLAGVFIFGVINYGLTFIGINPYWQYILKGIVIVFAVAFDIRKYIAKK